MNDTLRQSLLDNGTHNPVKSVPISQAQDVFLDFKVTGSSHQFLGPMIICEKLNYSKTLMNETYHLLEAILHFPFEISVFEDSKDCFSSWVWLVALLQWAFLAQICAGQQFSGHQMLCRSFSLLSPAFSVTDFQSPNLYHYPQSHRRPVQSIWQKAI